MNTKADKLADSAAGADELDSLTEAIHGTHWRPKGNGLVPTHYVPYFTSHSGHMERAACGAWVGRADQATEPTCPQCQVYLAAEPQTQEEAEAEAERRFGRS